MSKRINKVIELWEQGQPVYHKHPEELSYEAGINEAKTLADMFLIDFEHNPFDTVGLTKFIEGLKEGGPTNSGHATPAVVCTLPSNAITPLNNLGNFNARCNTILPPIEHPITTGWIKFIDLQKELIMSI